jgi:hypothetical protein
LRPRGSDDEDKAASNGDQDRVRQRYADVRVAIAQQQIEYEAIERDALEDEAGEDRHADRREEQR